MIDRRTRAFTLTEPLLRAYSRRGNFHADDDAARRAGLEALVAQGMQVAAPAYALLLEAWGDEWLASGELELRFVGMVVADETVEATVELDADRAAIAVAGPAGDTRVVGTARRAGR
jgi:acyl dehydratase